MCTRQKQGLTLDFQLDPQPHTCSKDFLCLTLKHFDKTDTEIQTSCCTTRITLLLIEIGSIVIGYIQRTHTKTLLSLKCIKFISLAWEGDDNLLRSFHRLEPSQCVKGSFPWIHWTAIFDGGKIHSTEFDDA